MDDMIVELDKQVLSSFACFMLVPVWAHWVFFQVGSGSVLHLMSGLSEEEQRRLLAAGGLDLESLEHLTLQLSTGNTAFRRDLEQIKCISSYFQLFLFFVFLTRYFL
jgi:hypothetical protein